MSKFKFINLIDKIFVTVVNFYIRSLTTTFILSLIFSFAIVYLLYFVLDKKKEKANISITHADAINKNFFAFKMLTKQDKNKLLKSILEKEHQTKLTANKLTFVKDNKTHLIIICCFIDNITQNDVYNLISEHLTKQIDVVDIIGNNFSLTNTKIFKNIEINLIDKRQLYDDYFLKYGIYPDDSNLEKNINKLKLKDVFKQMFLPNKAKSYFFCGLILIFSSIILPYHVYYLIFGSMLMLFAIICKILPKFNM